MKLEIRSFLYSLFITLLLAAFIFGMLAISVSSDAALGIAGDDRLMSLSAQMPKLHIPAPAAQIIRSAARLLFPYGAFGYETLLRLFKDVL